MSHTNVHDPELNIIKAVLDRGNFGGSLFNGLRGGYFRDAGYGGVWDYLRDHYRNYGKVPDQTTLLKDHPEFKDYILRARPVEPPEFYADLILEAYTKRGLADRLMQVVPKLEHDVNEGIDEITKSAAEFRMIRNRVEVMTLGNSGRERWQLYKTEKVYGVPWGWDTLDRATLGAHPGDLALFVARPGQGKGLPLDAPVLTPRGWVLNGSLREGDLVIGSQGWPVVVTGVYPQGVKDLYRVTFDDGTWVDCDDSHLWLTATRKERRYGQPTPKTVLEIRDTLRVNADQRLNHSVQYVKPVHFHPTPEPLLVDPWLLGMWLGDGCHNGTITNPETDLIARIGERASDMGLSTTCHPKDDRCDYVTVHGLVPLLRELGLEGLRSWEKRVPTRYLRASMSDRTELLRGLLDSDGHVSSAGNTTIEFSTTSEALAKGTQELVWSLGGRCVMASRTGAHTKGGQRHETRVNYRLRISFPEGGIVPVSSAKHLSAWKPVTRYFHKFIVSVEHVGRQETQCISVNAPDRLYVTKDYNVTHNTWVNLYNSHVAWQDDYKVLVVATEVPPMKMLQRLDALHFRLDYGLFKQHLLTTDQEATYESYLLESDEAKERYSVVHGTGLTPSGIGTLIEQMGPDIVFIDSVHKLEPDRRYEAGWEKMRHLANELKDNVAQRYKVPVICNTHFNREVGSGFGGKRVVEGGLENIAGGDEWGKVADLAVGLSRKELEREHHAIKMTIFKGREAEDHQQFHVKFDFSTMDFSETKLVNEDDEAISQDRESGKRGAW